MLKLKGSNNTEMFTIVQSVLIYPYKMSWPAVLAYAYNCNTPEVGGGSQIQGQPGLYNKTPSLKEEKKRKGNGDLQDESAGKTPPSLTT